MSEIINPLPDMNRVIELCDSLYKFMGGDNANEMNSALIGKKWQSDVGRMKFYWIVLCLKGLNLEKKIALMEKKKQEVEEKVIEDTEKSVCVCAVLHKKGITQYDIENHLGDDEYKAVIENRCGFSMRLTCARCGSGEENDLEEDEVDGKWLCSDCHLAR